MFFGKEEVKAGENRLDFFIENKIVLECKTKKFLGKKDYYQLSRYLKAIKCKLGLLVNFRDEHLKPRRVLNPDVKG